MNYTQIASLIAKATTVTNRIHHVQSEPAVAKAVAQAGTDIVAAAKSVARAVAEVLSAWSRSAPETTFRPAA